MATVSVLRSIKSKLDFKKHMPSVVLKIKDNHNLELTELNNISKLAKVGAIN